MVRTQAHEPPISRTPAGISPGLTGSETLISTAENQLIARLPKKARSRLLAVCESVNLDRAEVLCSGGDTIRFAYFPQEAFVSVMTVLEAKPVLEVGLVGREGMLGAQLALGVKRAPLHAVVQGAGSALRVSRELLQQEIAEDLELRQVLNGYLYVVMSQLTTAAACLRFHAIAPRLARWLLMTRDRARSDRFQLTHENLARMLGVRRVGITEAATGLQRQNLIEYSRGDITILDPRGMSRVACSCYANDLLAYERWTE